MREITGEYKGFKYDISFVSDAEKTICVFAIILQGEIVDIRSEVFRMLPLGADGERAILQALPKHSDQIA